MRKYKGEKKMSCQICFHECDQENLEVIEDNEDMFWVCQDCFSEYEEKTVKIVAKNNGDVIYTDLYKNFLKDFNGGLDKDNRKNFKIIF
jgi:Zn-finger protein